MSVTAVVLAYGHQEFVDYCVAALHGFPTLIVDNGSPEPLHAVGAPTLRLSENRQATGGCNACMEWASAFDYVWLLCDDVLDINPIMGWALYNKAKTMGRMGGIAPSFADSGWKHMHADPDNMMAVDWLECNMLIPMATWRDVGEYDTRFNGWGMDIDWGLRAMAKGYKSWVDGRFTVRQRPNVQRPTMVHKDSSVMARGLCEKYGVPRWETLVTRWM